MSHEDQTALRIRRTHKFLQEAMIELITEQGFEAITVGDITERAMINRATFYRHYQDKPPECLYHDYTRLALHRNANILH